MDNFSLDDRRGAHAWNAVKIAGKWRLVDATWGAGWIKEGKFDKSFVEYYFCPPPQSLIMTHFPRKKEEQFSDSPVAPVQFTSWPFCNPGALRALLIYGFDPSAIQDKLTRNIQLVEAYPIGCPLKVQAPLERELDSQKSYTIKVEALAISDMAIIHAGKWRYATKRGDNFTCTCRGMEGDMLVTIKPFGEKEYKSILKYQGAKGR